MQLNDAQKREIIVIDSRLADHTLSEEEHDKLRKRKHDIMHGNEKDLRDQIFDLVCRLEKAEKLLAELVEPAKPPKSPKMSEPAKKSNVKKIDDGKMKSFEDDLFS